MRCGSTRWLGARGRRAVGIVLGVALLAGVHPQAALASVCGPPRCFDVRVPLPHGVKVPDNRVRVLLPTGYKRHGSDRYPVLYVLHGVGDTYASWMTLTDIDSFTGRMKVIIVMPDGGKGSEAGWYSDWKDGSRQWETFHTKVLVQYVDRTYRTLGAKHRGILGLSMGGFGAMSYAARHPGLFRAAASFSGFNDTMYGYPLSGPFFQLGGRGFGGQSLGTPTDGVWGNQLSDEHTWREHNPTDLAAKLKGVWLYVASSTGLPGGPAGEDPSRPYSYAEEEYIYQSNLSFTGALDDAGVKYTSDFHGGYHHWPYWQWELHRALPMLLKAI